MKKLMPFQSDGVRFLLSNTHAILADDMGLGKTVQALSFMEFSKREQGKLKALVVCPTALIYNWENEIRKFVPGMSVCSHKGIQRKKNTNSFSGYDIIISSYHTVRQDIDFLKNFHFHYIILDESQVIKNPGSVLYHTMIMLRFDFKIVLTGTPVENSLTVS